MWSAIISAALWLLNKLFGGPSVSTEEKLGQSETKLDDANAVIAAQKRAAGVQPVDAVDELRKHDF